MRITRVKAVASRLVLGMAEMKSAVRSKPLEKHTASLIFLHGSGECYSAGTTLLIGSVYLPE